MTKTQKQSVTSPATRVLNVALDKPGSIETLLRAPAGIIAETLTGIMGSGKSDLRLSTGRLVQGLINNTLLTQLGRELKSYREKGKIKENYYATDLNRSSLLELLKFIDSEAPDQERFKAMKSIFFASVEIEADKQEEYLAYELMQTCKQLSSRSILVLKTAFQISETDDTQVNKNSSNRQEWITNINIAISPDIAISSLIEKAEEELIQQKLISMPTPVDGSGFNRTDHYRLTDLGYQLCQFMTKY